MDMNDSIIADGERVYSNATTHAHDNLLAQREAQPNRCLSLHSMWRAAGEPEGKCPVSWLNMTRLLIEGMEAYFAAVAFKHKGGPAAEHIPGWAVLDPLSRAALASGLGELYPSPYLQVGDVCASLEVATLYGFYLDNRGVMNYYVSPGEEDDFEPGRSTEDSLTFHPGRYT